MDPLAIALEFIAAIPSLIAAGRDVIALAAQTASAIRNAQLSHSDPTAADWNALDAQVKTLRAALRT